MRKSFKATLATTLAGVALAAGVVTAPPASAELRYNLTIKHIGIFVADFCLLTSTSGNDRAACSGNKAAGGGETFSLSAPYNLGDEVWLDVNVVWGVDRKRSIISRGAASGASYCTVSGNIAALRGSIRCDNGFWRTW
ncbi:hypothetical protein ACSDR0_17940 [Streptosporangium sp. G11]|uniref:hypothetical protein n=1 Tax=Streptosporangium sp. G11 TaxID=3436926 RepID=UPI003EBD5E6B